MTVRTFRRTASAPWTLGIRSPGGPEEKLSSGTRDRRAAESLARLVDGLLRDRAAGLSPDPAALRRLEGLPPRVREWLAERRLCPPSVAAPSLEAALDELAHRQHARSVSGEHVARTRADIEAVAEACGWRTLTDMSGDTLRQHLSDRVAAGLSAARANRIRSACRLLSRWAHRSGRLPTDPLLGVDSRRESTDRRRVRRALSDDELSALLDAAGRGPVRFGLSGPARRALYLAAVATGFRSGELRSLAPEAFDWTGDDGPTVALEAGSSKNRRAHVQPLASWAVAELRAYVTACPPRRPVWQLRRDRAALMLGDDLDAARAAWIDAGGADAEREQRRESDYLRRVDSLERRVDFHSLRACGVSRLLRAGVGIHLVQRWARHCSPVLTMRHYAQIGIGDLRGALDGARLGGAPPNRAAGPRAAAG